MPRPSPATVTPEPARRQRDEDDFERWLARATERLDPFMAWLGVVFALVVGYELAFDVGPRASTWLTVAGWSLWAVFVVEFASGLWLAPRRTRFLRRHWLRALALLVPTLRALRFLRLFRAGRALPAARVLSSSYRSAGTARKLVGSRLGYVGGLGVVATLAVAQLAFLFERDHPDAVFTSFGDALLWSAAVVLGLQGDPVPQSTGAHLAMLAGFVVGLVVIASLAGTLGAYLIDARREREEMARVAGDG